MPKNTNDFANINSQDPVKLETADWSHVTKDLIDSLPPVWTRGLLYLLILKVSLILPWALSSMVDETGTATGRLEPQGKTVRLDSPVTGTVAHIQAKIGDTVKSGQVLLVIESELIKSQLAQSKNRLEGELIQYSQLILVKNQLIVTLSVQKQQNQFQELEKQSQTEQALQNLIAAKTLSKLQIEEKQSQLNQARLSLESSKNANKIISVRLGGSQREVKRYYQLWELQVIPETRVVEKQDIVQEQQRLYEQSKYDIQQAQLKVKEQESNYQRTMRQINADIQQAELRFKEQENSYNTLTHTNKINLLKTKEQLKNLDREISSMKTKIAETKSEIKSLEFQLQQRVLKANVSGILFQLPIEKPGSVVQDGAMVAEIAPIGSPLIVRAQIPTTDSGSLYKGLPVKLKFDAYPFQDYGVVRGKLINISPTTTQINTPMGKVAAYELEITLNQDCIPHENKCIPLIPGNTVIAEVIVRRKRIIDFLIDPFKRLKEGGINL
jgi:hemolysin D